MGRKSKIRLPPAPDPNKLIQQQAQVNRLDQTTPFGSLTFEGPLRNKANLTLDPGLQRILNAQLAFGGQAAEQASPFLGQAGISPVQPQDTTAVGQSIFDLGMSRLQPQLDRQRAILQNQLEQSGNPAVGADLSPFAVSELDIFNRGANDLRSNLALQSIIEATNQRGRLLEQDLLGQQGNLALAQGLAGSNTVPFPGISDFFGPGPLDVTGPNQLAFNAQMQRAQAKQQQKSSFLGGLFDLGAAVIPAFL